MKILVVSQYFYPENFRINDLCFEMQKRGHEVTVLTGFPNYPEGYFFKGYEDKKRKEEIINDVRVIRCNLVQRKKDPVHLFLNYLSFAYNAKNKVNKLNEDFDIIFVFEVSPITQIIPAMSLKKNRKIPLIVNCQDIWPDVIKVYGIKEKSLVFKLIKKLSSYLYRQADMIITSSPGFNDYLISVCNVEDNKLIYVPNHAEDFYLSYKNLTKENEKLHILFAGNIGKAQDLKTLVNAISLLDDSSKEKIIIDILGDGSYLYELKQIVIKKNLNNFFVFHGRKDITEIKKYYEKANAFLLTLEGNSPLSMTIPSKLQGYMGAGKPILAAINGGAKEIIEKSNCGLCVHSGQSDDFSKIIREFIDDKDNLLSLGENGRNYFIKHFKTNVYIDKIEKLMEEVL